MHLHSRLYTKGRILGHKRGKRNSRPNQSLIQIEGVDSAENARSYLGKVGVVAWHGMASVGVRYIDTDICGSRIGWSWMSGMSSRMVSPWDMGAGGMRGMCRLGPLRLEGVCVLEEIGLVGMRSTGGRDRWTGPRRDGWIWRNPIHPLPLRYASIFAVLAISTTSIRRDETRADLQRIAYVYKAKREINGSRVRVIWG